MLFTCLGSPISTHLSLDSGIVLKVRGNNTLALVKRKLYQAADVPLRFYKWKWQRRGLTAEVIFGTRSSGSRGDKSCQMSVFERHISALFDLLTGPLVCCCYVELLSCWFGYSRRSLILVSYFSMSRDIDMLTDTVRAGCEYSYRSIFITQHIFRWHKANCHIS